MSESKLQFAVIGNPIEHSKSPQIHEQFAKQFGIDLQYERILAPIEGFVEKLNELRALGLRGCNVTVPFKLEAYAYAQEHSKDVLWSGASNTLSFTDVLVKADNTDGVGLVRDISHNLGMPFKDKKILLLGAGGAARGVLRPILSEQPSVVMVKNRSLDKAKDWLASIERKDDFLSVRGQCQLAVSSWADKEGECEYDVIINATASGLSDHFTPPLGVCFAKSALAYDMMYGRQTTFLNWAQSFGIKTADGWGMLVEQAAKSFEIWHGVMPNTRFLLQRGI